MSNKEKKLNIVEDTFLNSYNLNYFEEMEKKYGPPGNLKPILKNSILYHLRN